MDEEKTRPTGFPWPVAALSLCFIFSSAGPLSAEEAQHSVTLENRSGTAIVVKVIGPTLHIVEMTPEETASFNSKPGVYYLLLRYSTEPLHSYAKLGPFTAQQSSFARSVITIPQYSLVSEHAELSPIAAEEFDKAGRTFPFRVENKSSENVLVRILGPLHRQLTLRPGPATPFSSLPAHTELGFGTEAIQCTTDTSHQLLLTWIRGFCIPETAMASHCACKWPLNHHHLKYWPFYPAQLPMRSLLRNSTPMESTRSDALPGHQMAANTARAPGGSTPQVRGTNVGAPK